MKQCFKCLESKPLDHFYKHPNMADGHVNKCKECNKIDVSTNYRINRDHYIVYEKMRFHNPNRKQKALEYQRKRRAKYPEKNLARSWTHRAIQSHHITKQSCEICGSPAQAHHSDYSNPDKITWLCRTHHLAVHGKIAYPF